MNHVFYKVNFPCTEWIHILTPYSYRTVKRIKISDLRKSKDRDWVFALIGNNLSRVTVLNSEDWFSLLTATIRYSYQCHHLSRRLVLTSNFYHLTQSINHLSGWHHCLSSFYQSRKITKGLWWRYIEGHGAGVHRGTQGETEAWMNGWVRKRFRWLPRKLEES